MTGERLRVFGVDPGPTPGIAMLHYVDGRLAHANLVQATWPVSVEIFCSLMDNGRAKWPMTLVGCERFVTRGRTDRSGRLTLDLVGMLQQLCDEQEVAFLQRTASQVKTWATDNRLKAVAQPRPATGKTLLDLTTGMRHARDAARHALFTAVHDGLIPDPLSKKQTNEKNGSRA
jgi:hypothetical protein